MEKVFGAVILYQPTSEVRNHIATYSGKISRLFVFDNSEPAATTGWGPMGENVVLIADGVNRGIAERLNEAAERAINDGADWLLTMDQDSFFGEEMFDVYLNCLEEFKGKEQVAMFGVEYEQKPLVKECTSRESEKLITSGSMVNLLAFRKLEGFDEKLFIDEVDSEYCFKAAVFGYKTIQFENIFLNHSLGTVSKHRSLKSFKKTSRTLHSPLRVYYMVRNFLYVSQKYKKQLPASFPHRKQTILNRIKNNFFYGTDRVLLVKYLWLAYRHFKAGKMGRLKN